MDLRPDQLSAQLGKPLAPLWVVHGNAPLLSLEAADAIRAAARAQGFDERETLVVDRSFKWSELALAGGNLSLFGGAKLIDLRIPGGKPGREGGEGRFFVRLTVGQEDAVRFAGGAASLAGSVAAGVFIFSTAVWQASTHLEFRMFDVMLALALFALFIPMTARPRLHVPLVAGPSSG